MAKQLITTSELAGTRVLGGKNGKKRIGKVRSFVFHPKEKRCVGFIVKRPDLLWMFRRKDKFVSIDGYDFEDGRIVIRNVPEATDRAACKSLGVNWDDCVPVSYTHLDVYKRQVQVQGVLVHGFPSFFVSLRREAPPGRFS